MFFILTKPVAYTIYFRNMFEIESEPNQYLKHGQYISRIQDQIPSLILFFSVDLSTAADSHVSGRLGCILNCCNLEKPVTQSSICRRNLHPDCSVSLLHRTVYKFSFAESCISSHLNLVILKLHHYSQYNKLSKSSLVGFPLKALCRVSQVGYLKTK